ncbi:hypothetical protein GUJ93_ZPchr0013g34221 [Zizania palustris]|uniref:Uncharacterized protein n=1 Tax=Zizania palustris TaxID=103762 RepID=A0A8J5WWR7_ZIZPA|nr:hypothetical protein GUJ93_ZPchr0013g34221 [Zizania palustris]
MADIALLVTEEFERKLKRGAPGGAGDGDQAAGVGRTNFGDLVNVCSSWMDSASAAAAGIKLNVVEPKTGLAMAALQGFFSA